MRHIIFEMVFENMFDKMYSSFQRYQSNMTAVLSVVLLYAVMEWRGITCPIRFLTGISCAGCGMSRAWISLFHGDLIAAYRFHPLFWLPIPSVILYGVRRKIPRKLLNLVALIIVGLFLTVYVFRMMNPGDQIVVFHVTEGFFFRTIKCLYEYV